MAFRYTFAFGCWHLAGVAVHADDWDMVCVRDGRLRDLDQILDVYQVCLAADPDYLPFVPRDNRLALRAWAPNRRFTIVSHVRAIIALRCKEASSTWEAICNNPRTQTRTA